MSRKQRINLTLAYCFQVAIHFHPRDPQPDTPNYSFTELGCVSQKPRNSSGRFRARSLTLYLGNKDVSKHEHFLAYRYVKITALRNELFIFSEVAFRGRNVFGTFEKRSTGEVILDETEPEVLGFLLL